MKDEPSEDRANVSARVRAPGQVSQVSLLTLTDAVMLLPGPSSTLTKQGTDPSASNAHELA